jgi:hypothetical protein
MQITTARLRSALTGLILFAGLTMSSAYAVVLDFSDVPMPPPRELHYLDYILWGGWENELSGHAEVEPDGVTFYTKPDATYWTQMVLNRGANQPYFFPFLLNSVDIGVSWGGSSATPPSSWSRIVSIWVAVDGPELFRKFTFDVGSIESPTHIVLPELLPGPHFIFMAEPGSILRVANLDVTATPPVPEPSTYAMLLAGLVAIACMARMRKRQEGQEVLQLERMA